MTYTQRRTQEAEADRLRKASARAADRDLVIPPCENPRRRRQCKGDPERFCRTYLADMFDRPFTPDGREMLLTIVRCSNHAACFALAGPRGAGKSTVVKGAIIYLICYGLARFPVIIGKNAGEADTRLDEIKDAFENNELLAADFPEICHPIRALGGWASRGRLQTVAGIPTRIKWAGHHIIFPTVAGSDASGTVLLALGKESAIRGQNIRNRRPDLAVVDDIEDRESVKSETQTADIVDVITKDIAGLAGQGRMIPICFPCTIARRGCVADQLTDRAANPSWNGRRFQAIVHWPDNEDLWTKYHELRQRNQFAGDDTARAAHAFYLANRRAMDAGAEVSNPYAYDPTPQPDGSTMEASALQHWQNFICDHGREAFDTEYQNAPPADSAGTTTGLTVLTVMGRTNHLARGLVPAGAELLTAAIDVHGRHLAWTIAAFVAGRMHVIDYGADPVASPIVGRITDPENRPAVDAAILAALLAWRDRVEENGFPEAETGELRPLSKVIIDAGWHPAPVKQFCRDAGRGLFLPAKGFGTGTGQAKYRRPDKKGHGRRLGVHYHATRDPQARVWLYNLDADAFKMTVHAGFQLPAHLAGSITLFGSDPIRHRAYADQILAEMLIEEHHPTRGMIRRWEPRSRHNHWLDTTANCQAAAEIAGLRILTADNAAAMAAAAQTQAAAEAAEAQPATEAPPTARAKAARTKAAPAKAARARAAEPKRPEAPPAATAAANKRHPQPQQPAKRSLRAIQAAKRR